MEELEFLMMPEHKSGASCTNALKYLNIKPDGIYVDGTLGHGRYTPRPDLAKRLTTGRLIAIDRDEPTPSSAPQARLAPWAERHDASSTATSATCPERFSTSWAWTGWTGCSSTSACPRRSWTRAAGAFRIWRTRRWTCAWIRAAPVTAWTVVNSMAGAGARAHPARLRRGAPRQRASRAPLSARGQEQPVETTLELVDIIKSAMPGAALREKQHPAKRSFQAIRIAVNDELEAERETLR